MPEKGSISYSPDYKSPVESAMEEGRRIADSIIAANKLSAERSRLEREVIEASKKYRLAVREHVEYVKECMGRDRSHDDDEDPKWEAQLGAQCSTERALSNAVDALIDFESNQEKRTNATD